jgi:hypothetical protein
MPTGTISLARHANANADVDTDDCAMNVVEDNSAVVAGMMITNYCSPLLLYHPQVLTRALP